MEETLSQNITPLLSIIIPTKNRQYTCLHAIESALKINKNDFEIIIQDCSDTDILKSKINDKFGSNQKIKYEYTSDEPNMTTNWNRAYDRAIGDYQCGIGDDDGVLEEIYDLANWAKKNKIAAIVNASSIIYIWPDFENHFFAGSFVIPKTSNGKIQKLNDQNILIDSLCIEPSFLFAKLPMVYHCLISRDMIINKAKKVNKKLFHGTSLDVYTSVAFSKFYSDYISVDFPFTLKGSSGKSNSSRFYNKKIQEHFNEFKNHDYGKLCPKTATLDTTLLESIEKGLEHIEQINKIEKLNIPLFYAKIVAKDTFYLKPLIPFCYQNFKNFFSWLEFIFYLLKFKFLYSFKDFSRVFLNKMSDIFGEIPARNFFYTIGIRPNYVQSKTINENVLEMRKNVSPINYEKIN